MPSIKSKLALLSARLEAYLTTHAFTILFTAIYALAVFLMFVLGFQTEFIDNPSFTTTGLWFISLARGTGYTLNMNTTLVLLLSARLLFTRLRDGPLANILPLDAAFPDLHIVVGYVIAISVVFHGSFHMAWILIENGWRGGIFGFTFTVITGFCLLLTMVVIIVMGQPKIRKKHFRAFRILHVGGAFVFFLLLVFHGNLRQEPETFKWITGPMILYCIDRILRRAKAATSMLSLTAENAEIQDDIIVLRVPKPFQFQAGQFAEIQVPTISIEWHPFTIASAPHEKYTTFFIKAVGDWTGKLKQEMIDRLTGDESNPLKVQVRGPYGAPAQHVEGYERVVLVSGGVGATPFAAICKDLHRKNVVNNLFNEKMSRPADGTYGVLNQLDERVKAAISNLFGIDTMTFDHGDELKGVFAANMLNLTTESYGNLSGSEGDVQISKPLPVKKVVGNGFDSGYETQSSGRAMSNMTSYSSASEFHRENDVGVPVVSKWMKSSFEKARQDKFSSSEDEEDVIKRISTAAQLQGGKRKNMVHMYEGKAKLLAFLHTARVQLILLLILLLRMGVAGVGDIIRKRLEFGETIDKVFDPIEPWVQITDISLGAVFSFILILTIALEISYMGLRYFSVAARCFDVFAFVPLTLFSLALSIKILLQGPTEDHIFFIVNSGAVLPLLFILLTFRLHRAVRLRSLLTGKKPVLHEGKVPEVDFVWTTREEADDVWLRNELSPLAGGTELRLHRYVTRTKEVDVEAGAEILTSTHAGRPDWDEVFQKIAATATSRSTIGVFFCGPKTMGSAVQAALRKAEIASHLRAAYLSRTPEKVLLSDLGIPRGFLLRRLQRRGCGIRFVFREENFS